MRPTITEVAVLFVNKYPTPRVRLRWKVLVINEVDIIPAGNKKQPSKCAGLLFSSLLQKSFLAEVFFSIKHYAVLFTPFTPPILIGVLAYQILIFFVALALHTTTTDWSFGPPKFSTRIVRRALHTTTTDWSFGPFLFWLN